MTRLFCILSLTMLIFILPMSAQNEARLMRFPAIHGDQVVFSYAGDLYTVAATGGFARKITNHEGFEIFPRFSPDGKTIAFTGQYDGNTEIFTIPAEGGTPKRLTTTATLKRDDLADRMGPNNIVMAWTPDGKNIVYRSRKQSFNSFVGQLFKVSAEGGMSEELPLPTGGFSSYNADGSKLAFNRVFREFRTWKYYEGGMADDVWVYDFKTKETINITNHKAQDVFPMWHGNKIYYVSDRDRTANLFAYNTETKETEKLTQFTEYDIKFPSINGSKIIFENGGYLYVYDVASQTQPKKLTIQIADDFTYARNRLVDVSKNVSAMSLSPGGERIAVSARGEIFNVPAEEGITLNLTQSSGAHDRNVSWSPDGKHLAWISDLSGEFEIYVQKHDGSEPARQLTKNADTYYYRIAWSPDSKKILFSDKKMRLRYITVESGEISEVYQSPIWEMNDFTWSHDSKWIAFSKPAENNMSRISLFSLESGTITDLTDSWYSSSNPSFSTDGKYLFFTSKRDFNPIYSETEWNHAYRDMTKIYFVTLQKETPSPFAPKNDALADSSDKNDKDSKKDKKDEESSSDLRIDLENIQQRILALPIDAGAYWNLTALKDKVYYNQYQSTSSDGSKLKMFDLTKEKESELGTGMSYSLSENGKRMLIRSKGNFYLIDTPSSSIKTEKAIDLSGLQFHLNTREEWNQIYWEAWRQMRDFFYVENMHGVDWKAMGDKYASLLPQVNHRNDLTYLIGELIGELNVGHAYINGGDRPEPKRISTGLLGAKISKHSSGYFQIDYLPEAANWSKELRSPLRELGVNAQVGEFILAINGKDCRELNDIYTALIDKADKPVEIKLNAKPDEKGARTCIVTPIADESGLYYFDWVQGNIRKVAEATDGRVGYIHIPDMGPEGLNEFVKHFYPQLDKEALIIDDRGNGGGNVSPMIMERLSREITRSNMLRNAQIPTQTPRQMLIGPKVLLINNYSASDGDLFPYAFKKHQLGKVIGKRSWGGVVGIRGSLPFIDGADMRKPEFASYSAKESKWIIEGWGVEPDIEVDNDPAKEYAGIDEQLNKAIEVILEDLKNWDYKQPSIPVAPDKSK